MIATVAKGGTACQAIGGNPRDILKYIALKTSAKARKPLSLFSASIHGTALGSRGEIGFLIASVMESRGIFASSRLP